MKEAARRALRVYREMSKRKREKGIDLSCSLDTLIRFGRERKLCPWEEEEEGRAGGRRDGVITYCLPQGCSLGSCPTWNGLRTRCCSIAVITKRCRGAPWVGQVPGAPKPRGAQSGTHVRSLASCREFRDNISLPHLSPA